MSKRPSALLTESQREKLVGGIDERNYSRQYRKRIRERTENGTRDLAILFRQMEDRDIKQVFKPDRKELKQALEVLETIIDEGPKRQSNASPHQIAFELRHRLEELEEIVTRYEEKNVELRESNTDPDDKYIQEELRAEQKSILAEIHELVSSIDEDYNEKLEAIQTAENQLKQLPIDEYDDVLAEDIRNLRKQLTEQRRILSEDLPELRNTLEYELQSSDLSLDYIRDIITEVRDITTYHSRIGVRREAQKLREHIRKEINKPEFAPDIRQDVVKALAFYLRVSETLGTSTEELLEEALLETYDKTHPNDVVNQAIVHIESEKRQEAASRARQKLGSERLTNSELRALIETDPDFIANEIDKQSDVSRSELESRIIANPELVESGLTIVDEDPRNSGSSVAPDIVASDGEGNLVVVEVREDLDQSQVEKAHKRFARLVKEYGGKDRVRAMLVIPENAVVDIDEELSSVKERRVDVQSVPLN